MSIRSQLPPSEPSGNERQSPLQSASASSVPATSADDVKKVEKEMSPDTSVAPAAAPAAAPAISTTVPNNSEENIPEVPQIDEEMFRAITIALHEHKASRSKTESKDEKVILNFTQQLYFYSKNANYW